MNIAIAEFIKSGSRPEDYPEPGPEEIAFVGRSNVGKSSLLNVLASRRGLARTSRTPGRTRLVNFFRVVLGEGPRSRELQFVDLPGYGYAKVSKAEQAGWGPAIEGYLSRRSTLRCVVLLIDARRVPLRVIREEPALETERGICEWLRRRSTPVILVITKMDKLARHERRPAAARLAAAMSVPPSSIVPFSASTGEGRDALWTKLRRVLTPLPE